MKIVKVLVAVLVLAGLAFGQAQCRSSFGASNTGGVLAATSFFSIEVCNTAGTPCGSPASSLWKDAAQTQPLTNPFTSDGNGNYQWCSFSGTYFEQATWSGQTVVTTVTLGGSGGGGGGTITGATPSGGIQQSGSTLGLVTSCASGQVEQWNGTSWVCATVSGGGGVSAVNSGTGLTGGPITTTGTLAVVNPVPTGVSNGSALKSSGVNQPPLYQTTPVYDVRDAGFVGDGSTDNTTAAKTLLAAIGSSPATIIFPVGTYAMSTVVFPKNVILDFSGGGSITLITNTTSPGHAAFVNGTGAECGATSSCAAPSLSITSGNTIVAMVAPYPGFTFVISSVTDSCGNFYTQVQQSLVNQPRNVGAWVSSNSIAGSCAVTATANGTLLNSQIIVHQYSGMGPSVALDGRGASSNVVANPMSSGSATVTAGSLVIGYGGQPFTSETCTAGSGYTQPASLAGQSASGFLCAEYQLSSAGGSQSATQNITSTPGNLVYNMLPLKVGTTTLQVLGGINDPDLHQICFNCTGTTGLLDFTGNLVLQSVYPEWWGASPSATAATNTPALQAAEHGAFGTNRTNASGLSIYNKPLILSGNYSINAELKFYDVLSFKVKCDRRLFGGITQTAANLRIIDGQAIAYGSFDDCAWVGAASSTNALIDLDYNGVTTPADLAPQFIDFNRNTFSGSSQVDTGVLIAKSGGSAQGSNIYCWDCAGSGFTGAVWQVGGNNVGRNAGRFGATNGIDVGWYGGDMQGNPLYGIASYSGGFIFVRDVTMENGFTAQTGFDMYCEAPVGGETCIMDNVRSESRRLIAGGDLIVSNSYTINQSFSVASGGSQPVGTIMMGSTVGGDGQYYKVTIDGGAFGGAGSPSAVLSATSGSATTLVDTNNSIAGSVTNGIFVNAETVTQASTGSTGTVSVIPLSIDHIPGSVTSGTFANVENVTQGTTGAVGVLDGAPIGASTTMFLTSITGSADGTHTWTGSTSGAVFTPSGVPVFGVAGPSLVIGALTGSPDGTHTWTGGTSGAVYTPSGSPVAQAAWTTNAFNGMFVSVMSGTNIGCYGTVTSNTANTVTLSGGWITKYAGVACTAPDSTSTFIVEPAWNGGTVVSGGMTLVALNENGIEGSLGGLFVGSLENVSIQGDRIAADPRAARLINVNVSRPDWVPSNDAFAAQVAHDWDVRLVESLPLGGSSVYQKWSFAGSGARGLSAPFQRDFGTAPATWNVNLGGGPPAFTTWIGGRSDPNSQGSVSRSILEYGGILGRPSPIGTNQPGLATQIQGGLPTGSGTPGNIEFWEAPTGGSSGSTPQGGAAVAFVTPTGFQGPIGQTTPAAGTFTNGNPVVGVYEAGVLANDKLYTNTQALTTGAATHTLANSFTYTSSSTFGCTCTDQTAANACKAVPASAATVTLAGTGSDVLWLSCSGH